MSRLRSAPRHPPHALSSSSEPTGGSHVEDHSSDPEVAELIPALKATQVLYVEAAGKLSSRSLASLCYRLASARSLNADRLQQLTHGSNAETDQLAQLVRSFGRDLRGALDHGDVYSAAGVLVRIEDALAVQYRLATEAARDRRLVRELSSQMQAAKTDRAELSRCRAEAGVAGW